MAEYGKRGEVRAKVLALVNEGRSVKAKDVAGALGIKDGAARFHIANLEHEGLIERVPGGGVMEYQAATKDKVSIVTLADSSLTARKDAPEDAPAGPTGAAPDPPPEQPANEAPAPSPETLQAPVPFAGITWTYLEGRSMSLELQLLDGFEQLDDAARERVLQYAVDRWWLK